ncbi:MAG: putative transposase [Cellvibrionaceae bacterium]
MVQDSEYFLYCQRYIELNPVMVDRVKDPYNYVWSICQANTSGLTTKLHSPHATYLALGDNLRERQANYRELFAKEANESLINDIRYAVGKGLVLGAERFQIEVETLCGQRVRLLKRGPKNRNS